MLCMMIFLSQPMRGKTSAEITLERETIAAQYPEATILPTLFQPTQYSHPLEFLGAAIQVMAGADLVVMAPGWQTARGCNLEHDIATAYGLDIAYPDGELPGEMFHVETATLEELVAEDQNIATDIATLTGEREEIRAELAERLPEGTHPIGEHLVGIQYRSKLALGRVAEDYPQEVMPEIYVTEVDTKLVRKHLAPAVIEAQYEIKSAAPTVTIREAKK